MKRIKVKNLLMPIILTLGILLAIGCEKENIKEGVDAETPSHQHKKGKIEKLSFEELSNDGLFHEVSDAFNLGGAFAPHKAPSGKGRTSNGDGLPIDFSSVKKIESSNGTSYTFLIKDSGESPRTFENLVIEKTDNGTVRGFIMQYRYSERYLDSLQKGVVLPFEGEARRSIYKDNIEGLGEILNAARGGAATGKASTGKGTTVCVETTMVIESRCPSGKHGTGQYCTIIRDYWPGFYTQTSFECTSGRTLTLFWSVNDYHNSGPPPSPESYGTGEGIGGGPGGVTSPNGPNLIDDVANIRHFLNRYGLKSPEQIQWARYRPNRNMVNRFMEENRYSPETLNEAKMTIYKEVANKGGWDFSRRGTFRNRQALKYIATYKPNLGETMYLLENGLVLYKSATERRINKKRAGALASSEYPTDGYNYIYSYSSKRWYEYRLPKPSYAKADIDFLLDAFWDGAKIAARYATPLEDAIILIDGEDFDGVQQGKAQAAGFMIVGLIPGGKLLKPLSKGTGKVWKVVIKNGDKVCTRTVRELTQETIQHFDRYAEGASAFLQEALRKGDILDHEIVIEVGQDIADLSAKKGRKLSWPEVKALFKRGNDFNAKARSKYQFNEIHLANGKRLDSYIPGKEIVSRKATDLNKIKTSTFEKYLKELTTKYKKGTTIRSNRYSKPPFNIDGQTLSGDYVLEIPFSNKAFYEASTTLQNLARQYGVKIKYLVE